jgi:hypothetical protein
MKAKLGSKHPAPPASGNRANEGHFTRNASMTKPAQTPDFSVVCGAKRYRLPTRIAGLARLPVIGRMSS